MASAPRISSEIRCVLNASDAVVDLAADAAGGLSVLDFVRRERRLTGTKEGCKEGDCGACTVLVGELEADNSGSESVSVPVVRYQPVTSCLMPLAEAHGKHLVTIEGLDIGGAGSVQRRIVEAGASQCGFCTPGIAVSLMGRLMDGDAPSRDEMPKEVDRALAGHLCRCTGYRSLRAATEQAYADLDGRHGVESLVDAGELPNYFLGIPERLRALQAPPPQTQPLQTQPSLELPIVAGGTDLFVQRSEELPTRQVLALRSSLAHRPELRGVRVADDGLHVGALTSFEDLAQSEPLRSRIPAIADFMHLVASWQIRNRATVGGNLINASPIGDVTILMLALQAQAVLERDGETRTMPLQDLYLGYKQLDLRPGEILTEVVIPEITADDFVDFEKVSKRRTLDIATVNAAARLRVRGGFIEAASLAAGGVAPVPLALRQTSEIVQGRPIDRETLALAVATAQSEIAPISDVRGSADTKRLLVRNLLVAHFAKAAGTGAAEFFFRSAA